MNNRIVGIAGAALLIVGIFLPILNLFILTPSFFSIITGSFPPQIPGETLPPVFSEGMTLIRIIGVVLLLLGIGSLLLALKNQFKALIGTGLVSLCILVVAYIKVQSFFSDVPPQARALVGVGWGFYVMALGAIALIVAGAMKNPVPVSNSGWGGAPPPYTPGS
jgi:hypothetical protein